MLLLFLFVLALNAFQHQPRRLLSVRLPVLQDNNAGPPAWSETMLAALSRSELQALAKAHNVKANVKSSDIIAGLLQEVEARNSGGADASDGIAHPNLDEILKDQGVRLDDIVALRDAIMQAKEANNSGDDDDELVVDDDDDDDDDDESVGEKDFVSSPLSLSPGSAKSIADLVALEAQAVERAKANKARSDAIKERKRLQKETFGGPPPPVTPRPARAVAAGTPSRPRTRPPPPPLHLGAEQSRLSSPSSPSSGPEVVRWRNGAVVASPRSTAGNTKPVGDGFADAYFEKETEEEDKEEASDAGGSSREQPARAYAGPDLLEGVTLKAMVEYLEDAMGFEGLYAATQLRCFNFKPSVASALKVLRQTDMEWGRKKVEAAYIHARRQALRRRGGG